MKTSIFSRAEFSGTHVGQGRRGARQACRYVVSFDRTVTPDQMKATVFTYTLGTEIPKTSGKP